MKKVGLTLGKYAPLHKGHQFVIETALKECDEVIVVIYDSKEVTSIPLNVRSSWIKKLYPHVEVIEGWNGPSDVGYTEEVKRIQENYIIGLLNGRKITSFYSSEPYGVHMSKALGAHNRQVDLNRLKIPVSATKIRTDPYSHRNFISNVVYRDLITNVVFLGAPSTGKTTICEVLAKRNNTEWMPEYGREYWEKYNVNRRLSLHQLVEIATGHIEREDKKLLRSNKFLFTDTNATTTYVFSQYYHGICLPELSQLADICRDRYELVFVCDTDIPYEDTWDRSGNVNRFSFQQKILEDLSARNISFILLSGSLEERLSKVELELASFEKFKNKS